MLNSEGCGLTIKELPVNTGGGEELSFVTSLKGTSHRRFGSRWPILTGEEGNMVMVCCHIFTVLIADQRSERKHFKFNILQETSQRLVVPEYILYTAYNIK